VSGFRLRLATEADLAALEPLMTRAIDELLPAFLSPELVAASHEIMGLDRLLVADRTYFVAEAPDGTLTGGGGWSRRATLFGSDHTYGRDPALLDPASEPARIRAMYTHPDFTRRGIGRAILEVCEGAAKAEGFRVCELAATLSGEPLYRACGYTAVEPFEAATSGGLRVPLLRMRKTLARGAGGFGSTGGR
jgi:GNAT superfamily N-acetyltransferase